MSRAQHMPEATKPREMSLPAIRKRFDYGSWDSADCVWLYTKAEQHAGLLAALELMLAMTQDGWITPEDKPTDWQLGWEAACEQFKIARTNELAKAAIRKAQ